jgi:hypothetical protein
MFWQKSSLHGLDDRADKPNFKLNKLPSLRY